MDLPEEYSDDEGLSNHIIKTNIQYLRSDNETSGLKIDKYNSILNSTKSINVAITKYNNYSMKPKDMFCNCSKCAALNVIKESLAHPGLYGFSHNKVKMPKMLKSDKNNSKVMWRKKISNESIQIINKRPHNGPLLSDDPILNQIDEKLVTIYEKLDGLEKKIDSKKNWKRKRILFMDRSVQCINKFDNDHNHRRRVTSQIYLLNDPNGSNLFRESIGSKLFRESVGSEPFKESIDPKEWEIMGPKELETIGEEVFRKTIETKKESTNPKIFTDPIGQNVYNDSTRNLLKGSIGQKLLIDSIRKRVKDTENSKQLVNKNCQRCYGCVDESVVADLSKSLINRQKSTYYFQIDQNQKKDDLKDESSSNDLIEIKDSLELNRILTLQYKNKKISDDLLKKFARLDLNEINRLLKEYQLKRKNRDKNERPSQCLSSRIPIRKNVDQKKLPRLKTSLKRLQINKKARCSGSSTTFDIQHKDLPDSFDIGYSNKNDMGYINKNDISYSNKNDISSYFVFLDQNEKDNHERAVIQNIETLNTCNNALELLSKKLEYTCT